MSQRPVRQTRPPKRYMTEPTSDGSSSPDTDEEMVVGAPGAEEEMEVDAPDTTGAPGATNQNEPTTQLVGNDNANIGLMIHQLIHGMNDLKAENRRLREELVGTKEELVGMRGELVGMKETMTRMDAALSNPTNVGIQTYAAAVRRDDQAGHTAATPPDSRPSLQSASDPSLGMSRSSARRQRQINNHQGRLR